MGLHVIVGYDGQGRSANSFPVYVGSSAAVARQKMEESNAVRFEVFRNIAGVRKNNPRYVPPDPVKAGLPVNGGNGPDSEGQQQEAEASGDDPAVPVSDSDPGGAEALPDPVSEPSVPSIPSVSGKRKLS